MASGDVLWLDSKAKLTCLWLHGRPSACTWQRLSPHWPWTSSRRNKSVSLFSMIKVGSQAERGEASLFQSILDSLRTSGLLRYLDRGCAVE